MEMEKKKTDTLPMGGDASEALTALRELRYTVKRMMAGYRGNDLALAYDLISDAAVILAGAMTEGGTTREANAILVEFGMGDLADPEEEEL